MALTLRLRAFIALSELLQRVHLLPDAATAAAMPMAKRLAITPARWMVGPARRGVTTEDLTVPATDPKLRIYRPELAGPLPAVLHIHGGGWTVGGIVGDDHICSRMAADVGAVVVAVEYRLAPEHPYPAALDDCAAALAWLFAHADEVGVDPARVAIAGGSAGGNLAAALAIRCRDTNGLQPAAQILLYPAVDATQSTPSARDYRGPGLTPADLTQCWDRYAADASRTEATLSPLLADSLSGLPPAFVVTAEYDPLRDEGKAYAERLREAGVSCTHVHYDDYLHGFLSIPRLYRGIEAAWADMGSTIRQMLNPGGVGQRSDREA